MRSNAPSLLPIFRSQHQAELLARLFLTHDEVPMTDLARAADVPLTTVHREADRLEQAGLLTSRRVGRTRLLRADSDHPAADALTELLRIAFGPPQVIAEEFAEVPAERVIIFGSWAHRNVGEPGNFPHDIDVLVIGDYSARPAAYRAADAAQRRLGFEVNTTLRTPSEWMTTPYDPLVADVRQRPHLQVLPAEQDQP